VLPRREELLSACDIITGINQSSRDQHDQIRRVPAGALLMKDSDGLAINSLYRPMAAMMAAHPYSM